MKRFDQSCWLATAVLAISAPGTASAGESYGFYIDFTRGYGTAGTPAPSTYGDYDGGRNYDDKSYIRNSYAHSYSFYNNGVKLDVEAGVVGPVDNDGTGSSSQTFKGGNQGVYVGQFSGGLGVGWELNPGDLDDNYHTVDDSYGRDFLVLNFHEKVKLTKIDFDYYGPKSKSGYSYADFQVYKQDIHGDLIYTGDIPSYTWGKIEFDKPLEGSSTYVIAPKADKKGYTDYFKLRAVGGHTHPTVIPSPSAALAGTVLMIGLVARRRRRG